MGVEQKADHGRRIVLLAVEGEPTCMAFHVLERELGLAHVILEPPQSRVQLLRGRLKRLGFFTVAGQLLFQVAISPLLRRAARRRVAQIQEQLGLDTSPIQHASVKRVSSVNDANAIAMLKELKPDVVVVQGTRILSRRLLSEVNATFVNMHAGLTPMFRGVHGGYWAVATLKPELCGVTVHRVDPGIDTGAILAQARVPVTSADSFATYPVLQLGVGLPLLIQAVRDVLAGRSQPLTVPTGESRLWSHPTAWVYLWRRARWGAK